MLQIRNALIHKYGEFVTSKMTQGTNSVFLENNDFSNDVSQEEVVKYIKSMRNRLGNPIVPNELFDSNIEWGFDFSGWIGELTANKSIMIIGAEPSISANFQIVYEFGNNRNESLEEIALKQYNSGNKIWNYLVKIFADGISTTEILDFLDKVYICDLCHFVPKKCGSVEKICETLNIQKREWSKIRKEVANTYLIPEIEAVNPNFILLHGNPSRNFFKRELKVKFSETPIGNSIYKVLDGYLGKYKVISIPHLGGQNIYKIWKYKEYEKVGEVRENRLQIVKLIVDKIIKEN